MSKVWVLQYAYPYEDYYIKKIWRNRPKKEELVLEFYDTSNKDISFNEFLKKFKGRSCYQVVSETLNMKELNFDFFFLGQYEMTEN